LNRSAIAARWRSVRVRPESRSASAHVHLLHDPPALFLVYLAAAATVRGRGLGAELLEQAWAAGVARLCAQGLAARGMIWEVDLPAAATGEERRCRERRIDFFTRHGATPLPRAYHQPPLVAGGRPLLMQLLYRAGVPGAMIDADGVEALVRAMYFEKYMRANGIAAGVLDELLNEAEAGLRSPLPVRRERVRVRVFSRQPPGRHGCGPA